MLSSGVGSVQFLWGGVVKDWQTELHWTGFFASIMKCIFIFPSVSFQMIELELQFKSSNQLHSTCSVKPSVAEMTPWSHTKLNWRCWHRYLRWTDCSVLKYTDTKHRHRHLKQDNIQPASTCFCLSTSSAFIKSMNHTEPLKKQKFPKRYHSGGSVSSAEGSCQHHSPAVSHHCEADTAHQPLWW